MLDRLQVVVEPGWKPHNGFQPADYDLLHSPKGLDKIRSQLERTPYVFDIIVYMTHRHCSYVRNDIKSADWQRNALGRELNPSNKIVVFYTHNITSPRNYMPMTAWIMMHRMQHALLVHDHMLNVLIKAFDCATWSGLHKIYNLIYTPDHSGWKYPGLMDVNVFLPDTERTKIASVLFTMRSARNNCLTNPIDLSAEILAQYVITGRVKFNRVEEWDLGRLPGADQMDKNCSDEWTLAWVPNTVWLPGEEASRTEELNHAIDVMEQEVNAACKTTLDALVGQVVGW